MRFSHKLFLWALASTGRMPRCIASHYNPSFKLATTIDPLSDRSFKHHCPSASTPSKSISRIFRKTDEVRCETPLTIVRDTYQSQGEEEKPGTPLATAFALLPHKKSVPNMGGAPHAGAPLSGGSGGKRHETASMSSPTLKSHKEVRSRPPSPDWQGELWQDELGEGKRERMKADRGR